MKHIRPFLWSLLICLLLSSLAEAEFRALLVGINYQQAPKLRQRLHGAVNDVEEMRTLMTGQLGIPETAIRVLTETSATRENILNAFAEWLIQGTQPGDTVFFMYAGHGGQEEIPQEARRVLEEALSLTIDDPVKLSSEQQKMIEFLIPYDTLVYSSEEDAALPIFDLEFHTLLKALQGRNVHLFFDCCFSEGVTRDFQGATLPGRSAHLPWRLWHYPEKFSTRIARALLRGTSKGVTRLNATEIAEWFPEYSLFAAARFFQTANDLANPPHGAFTLPVLKLLRNNPGASYSNQDILDYARKHLQHTTNIPPTWQNPVFHGPEHAKDAPFVLLTQRPPAPQPQPEPESESAQPDVSVTRVRITGSPASLLAKAIRSADFLRLVEETPDVIVDVQTQDVTLYTAAGSRIKTLPMAQDITPEVMNALESTHVRRQLAALDNPAAPFTVELWMDEPGKTEFTTEDRVTLYYRVKELPHGDRAYFTLLNVAPGGSVSLLYPGSEDILAGMLEQRHHTAEVEAGRIHAIPKDEALQPGENAAVDLRLRLEQGQEYFKAIVTSQPIPWERLYAGDIERMFHGSRARGIAGIVEETLAPGVPFFWAAGNLRVHVE